ncbi:MAG: LacI family DNA-binding transcriptional regulator [Xanthomonadaceae bacterium]|jgi:DNA-binding LacI/PurR family transcriptional regulator|nr:LacI family DNA-binding transcriptional regulator [Xanthomonadaceae bacterium]
MANDRNAPTRLTMADIARRAGVAESTVSRALADNPRVAKSTRRRIQQLAAIAGYTINPVAQSLRSQRTRTISVAIPLVHERRQPLSDPFLMNMLAHLADALSEHAHSMLLSKVPVHEDGWVDRLLQSGRADGVILIGQSHEHATIDHAARSGLPLVVWGARMERQAYASIGSDNRCGGELATQHLLARGRRRIAFLGDERLPEVGHRHEGYARALAQAGLKVDPRLSMRTHFSAHDAYLAAMRLIARSPRLDAVVAASDVIAASTLRALLESGRRVPHDVAVVGYDDTEMASYTSPPLTTVRQDVARGAALLVERVLSGRATAADSVEMSPELQVRAST